MGRVLGATRLSHDTDASTSIERQREAIEGWSRIHGHDVVAITEDADVSGSIKPHDRDDLGTWLTNPAKLAQWDILCVAKLDRLTRSVRHFDDLRIWADEHGKTVASVAESLDLSTSTGLMFANLLAMFAQFERDRMSERRAEASRKLYSRGGYNGGNSLPWGYKTIQRNGRLELEPDPDQVAEIRLIVDKVLAGQSVNNVADEHGIDPRTTLHKRLKRVELKGWVTYNDEIVRDDEGLPVMRPPIIDARTWDQLQAKLRANSKGAGVPHNAVPWLHVVYCDKCRAMMYRTVVTNSQGRKFSYYRHERRQQVDCRARVRADDLERQIHGFVILAFDGMYIPEVIEVPAEDHTAELNKIDVAISHYEDQAIAGDVHESVMRILEGLHGKRRVLIDAGLRSEARREVRYATELVTDRWLSLSTDHERGALLRKMGIRILARKADPGKVRIRLQQGSKHWADVARSWSDADVEQFEAESGTA